jgi:hypothetical protein
MDGGRRILSPPAPAGKWEVDGIAGKGRVLRGADVLSAPVITLLENGKLEQSALAPCTLARAATVAARSFAA